VVAFGVFHLFKKKERKLY